jgi:hypothetical protein
MFKKQKRNENAWGHCMLVHKNVFKRSSPVLANLKADDAKSSNTQYQSNVTLWLPAFIHLKKAQGISEQKFHV